VGSSTGGFTEVLLKGGAERVYAIDVGYGELDWKLRSDPRVVVMERTNARYVEALPEPISFVSVDVSFISLTKILPAVRKWVAPLCEIVTLVKPQFEAARGDVGAGGIVRDEGVHRDVLDRIVAFLPTIDLEFRGVEASPILGAEGNKEFLVWSRLRGV
jgi:23S rRNA (cytidine1920-2'-O)/16S rRNA (cytidine1409-2'-O)-methyltransferase